MNSYALLLQKKANNRKNGQNLGEQIEIFLGDALEDDDA